MSKSTSFRNVRKTNFTQVNNQMINDPKLTVEAKGLLMIFLSNSDDWNINMKEIISRSKNGRDAHYRMVKELIKEGYFARVEVRGIGKKGFEKMEYLFSDSKIDVVSELEEMKDWAKTNEKQIFIEYINQQDKPRKVDNSLLTDNQDAVNSLLTGNQDAENQDAENEYTENQYINNTKSNNTNINNTKSNNINRLQEEEILYSACSKNTAYEALNNLLQDKKVDLSTRKNIIIELVNRGMEIYSIEHAMRQYNFMMDKISNGYVENHNNFALFFVNGLEMRERQSTLSKEHKINELKRYEDEKLRIEKHREEVQGIYYNWLNEKE